MRITELADLACDKTNFVTIEDYQHFAQQYLEFIESGLQARIISQNENHYEFLQYGADGSYNITRPLNSELMLDAHTFPLVARSFANVLESLAEGVLPADSARSSIAEAIYTMQQCIGAALDALPSGRSNQARKINGDLFERLISLTIRAVGIECIGGVVKVPVKDLSGRTLFESSYQHDLLISDESELKVIGSVKTSSKDRIDKIFVDKFLYARLTGTDLPHIAVFLNDVQRKKTRTEGRYGISATFLPGHFKAYTIKLNALDGVYYCDIRPNMVSDSLLSQHIKTIDHLYFGDLWQFVQRPGASLADIEVEQDEVILEVD